MFLFCVPWFGLILNKVYLSDLYRTIAEKSSLSKSYDGRGSPMVMSIDETCVDRNMRPNCVHEVSVYRHVFCQEDCFCQHLLQAVVKPCKTT